MSALAFRSRAYAAFRGVTLGLQVVIASAIQARFAGAFGLFVYLHATVFLHAMVLMRPRLFPGWYRALVSIPGAFFSAGTLLALPWALLAAFRLELPAPWLPYLLAL